MRRDAERLKDIVRAAEAIAQYLETTSRERLLVSGMEQHAILRQLIVVGAPITPG